MRVISVSFVLVEQDIYVPFTENRESIDANYLLYKNKINCFIGIC